MGRRTDENLTYPSIAVDRQLYFAYMSEGNRPKPAELLELAMCAYMQVESGREATYRNILEMKRQLSNAFAERKAQADTLQEEIRRAEQAEKEAARRKLTMMLHECFVLIRGNDVVKEPSTSAEVRARERFCERVKDRMWDRYQYQPSNLPDDLILEVFFKEAEE